jgi:non-ribosomal peptide synthetase component E (peptide arylation enzyme)
VRRQLPSGHLVVEGRIKNVINRGGENVPAAELKEHLLAHPTVTQVAVVALPERTLGEMVCAVITASGPAPPSRNSKRFSPTVAWPATSCRTSWSYSISCR